MYYGMNILLVHVGPCQRVVGIIFEIKGYRWREGILTEAIYLHSTPETSYISNPRTPLPFKDLFSNISMLSVLPPEFYPLQLDSMKIQSFLHFIL